jgi:hypothetical protein
VRFVGFISAKKIKPCVTLLDRAAQAKDRRKPPRFFMQAIRINSTLVGIRRRTIGHVVLGRGRRAVKFQPRQAKLTALEQSAGHFVVKLAKRARGEATGFAEAAPAALVQVDDQRPGRLQLGVVGDAVPCGASRIDYAAFELPQLLAM